MYIGTSVVLHLHVACHIHSSALHGIVVGEEAACHLVASLACIIVVGAGIDYIHSTAIQTVRIATHYKESIEHGGIVARVGVCGGGCQVHCHHMIGVVGAFVVLWIYQPCLRHLVVIVNVGSEHRAIFHSREVAVEILAFVLGWIVEVIGVNLSLVALETSIHAHSRRQYESFRVGHSVAVFLLAIGFLRGVALDVDVASSCGFL